MKNYKSIISMMSGTSIDSIDACLVHIFEDLSFKVIDCYSLDYPTDVRNKLFDLANNIGDVKDVCFMNFVVGELFAKCAKVLIDKHLDVDFISSHGQTICHLPQFQTIGNIETKSTLQIGDISVIAQKTGVMTVGDFRTKDVAAGGDGAPLVPFADKILFGLDKNRLIQNIGGISNVSVLSKDCDIFAFDNGVGNMLIDYYVNKFYSLPFDIDGEIAKSGNVDEDWLNYLLSDPYYSKIPPKTTGRELFNNEYAEKMLLSAPERKENIIATITALTARVIADSYENFVFDKTNIDEVVLGGGGAYNKTLISLLKQYLPNIQIKTHAEYGIPDKLKEAIAFAYLGYYTITKQPNNIPECTGASSSVVMGKIAY